MKAISIAIQTIVFQSLLPFTLTQTADMTFNWISKTLHFPPRFAELLTKALKWLKTAQEVKQEEETGIVNNLQNAYLSPDAF